MIGFRVVTHWVRQTPLLLQPVIASLFQFTHSMGREEFTRDEAPGQFKGHRLRAILAKFE